MPLFKFFKYFAKKKKKKKKIPNLKKIRHSQLKTLYQKKIIKESKIHILINN